jgi:hypothetical protein
MRSNSIHHWLEVPSEATTSQSHWLSSDWQAGPNLRRTRVYHSRKVRHLAPILLKKSVVINIKVAYILPTGASKCFHTQDRRITYTHICLYIHIKDNAILYYNKFLFNAWSGVRLCPLSTQATSGPILPAQDDRPVLSSRRNKYWQGK